MAADATKAITKEKENARNPVRQITLAAILTAALLFVWYVVVGRVAPWTDEARVQAWVIPIAPKVSGIVRHVNVKPDQRVKAGAKPRQPRWSVVRDVLGWID